MRGACLVGLVGVLASLSGCYSKATARDGKFTFAYASGLNQIENFVKPIAPGSKLDVVAFVNGTENKLSLVKALSSSPDVLAIEGVSGTTLTLKGVSPGTAVIELTAKDEGGNTLTDRMYFHVAKPALHGLEHSCTKGAEAVYVRGSDAFVFHAMKTADKRPVMGYGFAPLKIEPAGALELVAQPQDGQLYRFQARTTHARVTLRSTVDDGALGFRIVERGELKEATLLADDRLVAGREMYVVAETHLGDTPVCSQDARTTARSLTPDVCKVTARLDDDEDAGDENHEQLAIVTGLRFGECAYEVTLPELAGGKGVTLSGKAKVGRLEFPGEGKEAPLRSRLLHLDDPSWPVPAKWRAILKLPLLLGLAAFLSWQWRRARCPRSLP